jgi:hypothetical protein
MNTPHFLYVNVARMVPEIKDLVHGFVIFSKFQHPNESKRYEQHGNHQQSH